MTCTEAAGRRATAFDWWCPQSAIPKTAAWVQLACTVCISLWQFQKSWACTVIVCWTRTLQVWCRQSMCCIWFMSWSPSSLPSPSHHHHHHHHRHESSSSFLILIIIMQLAIILLDTIGMCACILYISSYFQTARSFSALWRSSSPAVLAGISQAQRTLGRASSRPCWNGISLVVYLWNAGVIEPMCTA